MSAPGFMPNFWKKAVKDGLGVAAVGLGGSAAFFVDAGTNLLQFTEPLTAMIGGAVLGAGMLLGGRYGFDYRRMRRRAENLPEFIDQIQGQGFEKLADEIRRLHSSYTHRQVSLRALDELLDTAVERYIQDKR